MESTGVQLSKMTKDNIFVTLLLSLWNKIKCSVLKYANQAIDPAKTIMFLNAYQEDDLESMTGVKLKTVENGCNRFLGVNAKLRAAEFEKIQASRWK